jgi:hypothetical protein
MVEMVVMVVMGVLPPEQAMQEMEVPEVMVETVDQAEPPTRAAVTTAKRNMPVKAVMVEMVVMAVMGVLLLEQATQVMVAPVVTEETAERPARSQNVSFLKITNDVVQEGMAKIL